MNRLLDSGFEIICNDKPNNGTIIVEIEYKKEPVAQLIKNGRANNIDIFIYTRSVKPEELTEFKFLLRDFIEAIDQAKNTLNNL
jgi:hypothetical protein